MEFTISEALKDDKVARPRTARIDRSGDYTIVWLKQTTQVKDGVFYFEAGVAFKDLDRDTLDLHAAQELLIKNRAWALKAYTSKELSEHAKINDGKLIIFPCDKPEVSGIGINNRERDIRSWTDKGMEREKAEDVVDHPENYEDAFAAFGVEVKPVTIKLKKNNV